MGAAGTEALESVGEALAWATTISGDWKGHSPKEGVDRVLKVGAFKQACASNLCLLYLNVYGKEILSGWGMLNPLSVIKPKLLMEAMVAGQVPARRSYEKQPHIDVSLPLSP